MKRFRYAAIPALAALLCLSVALVHGNISNSASSDVTSVKAAVSDNRDAEALREIKDEYPPKASFGSEEDSSLDDADDTVTVKSEELESATDQTTTDNEASDLQLLSDDRNCTVTATVPSDAQLSEDTDLHVERIMSNTKEYSDYRDEVVEVLESMSADASQDKMDIGSLLLFDISLTEDGEEVEPTAPVSVEMSLKLKNKELIGLDNAIVVHFDKEHGAELLEHHSVESDGKGNVVANFETDSFSVFAIVGTSIEKNILASDGKNYKVTVTAGADSGIPAGAELEVNEILDTSDEYKTYVSKTERVLEDTEQVTFARFFDISIMADGKEIQPTAPVEVKIELADELTEDVRAVHFTHQKDKEKTELLDTELAQSESLKDAVKFETDGFSVYGVVLTELFTEVILPGSNDAYTVKVTAPPEAKIPEGSTLQVKSLEEGTEAYEYARNAVLADRKEKGDLTDAGSLNLAALDISILDPDGKELEPAAAVTVDIKIKELPGVEDLKQVEKTLEIQHHVEVKDGVVVETVFDGGTDASFQMETDEKVAAEGTAVDPNAVSEEENVIDASFETPVFSTFTVTWNSSTWPYSSRNATIHYVDENNNSLTVSNGQPVNDTTNDLNYLIYDIDGYEYDYTYRNTKANRITPILRYQDKKWKYTTGTNKDDVNNNTWNNLLNSDNIYVVYKPKATVPQGGTPVPKISGEKPKNPTITKDSVVNGDGTNTLSLSVTGHTSIMEAEKLADVIVVFDISGSMNDSISGAYMNLSDGKYYYKRSYGNYYYDARYHNGIGDDGKYYRFENEVPYNSSRIAQAKSATNTLAKSLLSRNTQAHPDLIRMSLISFSNTAQKVQDFTTDATTFNTAVNNLPSPDGGTNWEYALQLANEMAVANDRATFVIFVTDGNPTFRQTRGVLNNSGTGSLGNNDVTNYYFAYNVYGHGDSDDHGRNFDAALAQAQSIVNHNKNFYTIGISNDVTNLTKLTTKAGAGADHSKTATSNDELVQAFNDIAASIIAHLGHSDVKISDGITDLTQTVQKSTLVSFAEDDFTYYKGHAATEEDVTAGRATSKGEMVWVSWTPSSEGCAEAVYNKTTGAVEWNMGEGFMLEDGYTYQVRFKVWPSQEAYDLLADLNNGKKNYNDLTAAEKAQISEPKPGSNGMYTLKTNSDTSYTYREATKSGETVTPTGEPSKPGSFPDVDPLELTTKPLKVKKQWHNNYVDNRTLTDSITMELYGVDSDGVTSHNFKTITLTEEGKWYADNNYISYGLVTYNTDTNTGEKVYETGHDFTLRETDDEAHYYELSAGVFRPMFINGTPTILEKVDAAPAGMSDSVFHYNDSSHHYYRLDGKIYRDTQSDTLLIATNSHRSYMDLKKEVVDESGVAAVDDTEFKYNITFTVPTEIENYDSVEKYIWFSVYDSVGHRLSPDEYTHTVAQKPSDVNSDYSSSDYANYLVATSGTPFTLTIKQGWNVRFLNLPIGTTYSFEESNIPTEYDFVKGEVSGTRWVANMINGEDKGQAVDMTNLPVNTSASNDNTGISGTIDYANARYKTTYTNKTLTKQVKIKKTSQGGTIPLPDAVFSLYTERGYNADPKTASKTDLKSDENGMIDLGKLSYGKYYLVETSAPAGYILLSEPVEITVSTDGVTYSRSDSVQSMSNEDITRDSAGAYILTVPNTAAYKLPSAGGPGTYQFTIIGVAILTTALLLLSGDKRIIMWRKLQNKE